MYIIFHILQKEINLLKIHYTNLPSYRFSRFGQIKYCFYKTALFMYLIILINETKE